MKLHLGHMTYAELARFFAVKEVSVKRFWKGTYSKKLSNYAEYHIANNCVMIDKIIQEEYDKDSARLPIRDLILKKVTMGEYFDISTFCADNLEALEKIILNCGRKAVYPKKVKMLVEETVQEYFVLQKVRVVVENGEPRPLNEEDKKELLETFREVSDESLLYYIDYFDDTKIYWDVVDKFLKRYGKLLRDRFIIRQKEGEDNGGKI